MFGSKNRQLKKRYLELAGMLKEIGEGNTKDLDKIKNRFCLQEGIKAIRAEEYLEMFEGVGLIEYLQGEKGWVYREKEEWLLFKVKVEKIEIVNKE